MTGTGTLGDPYILSTPADLEAIRTTSLTAYYELANDIDMSGRPEWVPIGATGAEPAFEGSFDGNDHTISNLTFGSSSLPTVGAVGDKRGVGFFGHIDNGGSVSNVRFDSATMTITMNVTGQRAAIAVGTLSNGSMSQVHVLNSTATIIASIYSCR